MMTVVVVVVEDMQRDVKCKKKLKELHYYITIVLVSFRCCLLSGVTW